MSTKTSKKTPGTRERRVRQPKTSKEISKELRERRTLDPTQSEMEDYLTPPTGHFRS